MNSIHFLKIPQVNQLNIQKHHIQFGGVKDSFEQLFRDVTIAREENNTFDLHGLVSEMPRLEDLLAEFKRSQMPTPDADLCTSVRIKLWERLSEEQKIELLETFEKIDLDIKGVASLERDLFNESDVQEKKAVRLLISELKLLVIMRMSEIKDKYIDNKKK